MTPMKKRGTGIRRNDRCICGSGKKFKYCCSPTAVRQPDAPQKKTHYIDTGEVPVRYVICDARGTSFFCDKDGQILVFNSRPDALAIATLDEFANQEPGEINVAGVGQTKWEHLQATLPYIAVESVEHAVALIRERVEVMQAKLAEESAADVTPPEQTPENE